MQYFEILKALRYILPRKLYPYLVEHVIYCLNSTLSAVVSSADDDQLDSQPVSTLELITGKVPGKLLSGLAYQVP